VILLKDYQQYCFDTLVNIVDVIVLSVVIYDTFQQQHDLDIDY